MVENTYVYAAIASGFSAFGSILVIFIHLKYKLTSKSDVSVLILQSFDLFESIITLIPAVSINNHKLCQIQAVLVQFVTLSGILWTACIGLIIRDVVTNKTNSLITIPSAFIIVAIFSSITALIPLIFNAYGPSGLYCWISFSDSSAKSNLLSTLLSMLLFYLFTWIVIVFCFYIYKQIIDKRNELTGISNKKNSYATRLRLYPIVLALFTIPITICRLLECFSVTPPFWFFASACFIIRMIGFANSLIYGLTPRVQNLISNSRYELWSPK